MVDVIVIGGSYAGISAALPLARARRSVLVLDAGERRNRFATHAHGFLGSDGEPPDAIAERGKAQLLRYPTVTWRDARASQVRAVAGEFEVVADGVHHRARRIVLAIGVRDTLPNVPGLAERWGESIFHCPYCHGYELDRGPLGVLASSPLVAHQAPLVAEWSTPGSTRVFVDSAFTLGAEDRAELHARGIAIVESPVVKIAGSAPTIDLHLRDGRVESLAGLFVQSRIAPVGDLATQLGCELEDGPAGHVVKTDAMKATSVPGVFACGDSARMFSSIPLAVADGAFAGVSVHRSLVFDGHRA